MAAETVSPEVGGRGWRLIVLCLLFLGSGLLLAFRVYSYQVVEHARFEELANAEHWERVTIAPRRGTIFDRNGYALARSVMYESVYAWTPSIEDVQAAADKLAPILAEPAGQVAEIIRQRCEDCRAQALPRRRTALRGAKRRGARRVPAERAAAHLPAGQRCTNIPASSGTTGRA